MNAPIFPLRRGSSLAMHRSHGEAAPRRASHVVWVGNALTAIHRGRVSGVDGMSVEVW
jgi:hypothetical protein